MGRGHVRTAMNCWLRAADYYRQAEFFLPTDDPRFGNVPVDMDLGVRPMTMNTNPDGSTKWIFVQLSGLNGFAVVDFATRKEIKRIENPKVPPGGKATVPGT